MSGKKFFWTEKNEIKCWKDVERLEKKFISHPPKKWIFRAEKFGQDLKINLEEKFKLNGITDKDEKRKKERGLIRTFQRKAALYLEREPDKDDILEWLAIMSHHRAPTRLLDWTYSFYVSVYFALAEKKEGIVWALDASTISRPEPIVKRICGEEDGFRKFSHALLYYMKKCDFLGIHQEGDKLIDPAIACYLIENPLL